MKTLLPRENNPVPVRSFSFPSPRWFRQTPQRALDIAYQAALTIRQIEEQHFQGAAIAPNPDQMGQDVYQCFADERNRQLIIIKIRLAEFRVGRFLFAQNPLQSLDKLRFISTICDRYAQLHAQQQLATLDVMPSATPPPLAIDPDNLPRSPLEKTGVLPRSIGHTVNRIKAELKPGTETEILQKFQRSRAKTQIACRCLVLLALTPLLVQIITKNLIFLPALEHWKPLESMPLFINSELKETTFHYLRDFKETLEFQNLLSEETLLSVEDIEKQVKEKAAHLAEESRLEGRHALANLMADGAALGGFVLVTWLSRPQIRVLKSFMDDVVYGLSDSAKAFFIILFTDMFVGFHSPHGWEVLLENFSKHLGLAPNHDLIFLFIATVPVFLDTIAKYWVFRYLSQSSPSAVATLRNMNE